MLNNLDGDFFEQCVTETSLFNKKFAEQDPDWNTLKNMYENLQFNGCENPIPKTIHFIWLGQPLPDWYHSNIKDWSMKNPDFNIKVWDNESSYVFMQHKETFTNFEKSKSFGIQSDILRYEILKYEGGLYVDTDFLCVSDKFNVLHDNFSFYAGICLEKQTQLNNGIMACAPGHPIVELCVESVKDPDLEQSYMQIHCDQTRVLYQTGPWLLTRCLWQYLNQPDCEVDQLFIAPSQTFHPFPARYREEANTELIKSFLKPCSMACHLWHASWQPNSKFYVGEMI